MIAETFSSSLLIAQNGGEVLIKLLLGIAVAVLAVVLLIKLFHIALFALLHPHVLGVLAGGGVILLVFAWAFNVPHAAVQNQPQAAVVIKQQRVPFVVHDKVVVHDPMLAAADENSHSQKPARDKTEQEVSTKASNPTDEKHSDAAADTLPAWTDKLPHRKGDAWVYVVHLNAQTDPALRDDLLDEEMVVCAQQYIDDHLYPGENVSKIVKISPNYLYDNCLRETYPASGLSESGKDVYARLEFDKNFREEIDRDYRQIMAQGHLNVLCGIVVAGLISLGGLYGYLRVSAPKAAEV